MTDERRHWILDPGGHRAEWAKRLPLDGSIVEGGIFDGAEQIVLPPPEDHDDWVCDFCNVPILTRWGDEPFPVPMDGSYALCAEHYEKNQAGPREEFGEYVPGTTNGRWPSQFCGCPACLIQAQVWGKFLHRGYEQLQREEAIAKN